MADHEEMRDMLVVKSNELVQKMRHKLSLSEQKTIAYVCAQIVPNLEEGKEHWQREYMFDVKEYAKTCGIDYDSGRNYQLIKDTLIGLTNKGWWLECEDGSEVTVRWLDKARTNKRSGIAHIRIDEDLAPYLYDLKERFFKYHLYEVLAMKSAYSTVVFELCKSHQFKGGFEIEVERLKELLECKDVKSYDNFKDFRRRVLDVACSEINELTDINVSYEVAERKGRKVTKLKFNIQPKDINERISTRISIEKKLEHYECDGQMSIEDFA